VYSYRVPKVTKPTNDIQESPDDFRKEDGQVITGTSSGDSFIPFASPFDNPVSNRFLIGRMIHEEIAITEPRKGWQDRLWAAIRRVNEKFSIPFTEEELQEIYTVSVKEAFDKAEQNPTEEKDLAEGFKKNKTQGTFDLATYITKRFNIITVGEKEREIFVYRDGIYFQAENEIIYPEIQRILGSQVTRSAKSETHHKICDMTAQPRGVFESAPLQFIPVANGVYNFQTKELLPHSSDYKFKYKFPIIYDPDATCPKTLAFFNQVLSEDQLLTVQEWIGYYFYRLYMFKKAVIFVGEGDTGKTTLLEVITYLLGRDNISSISLQKMSSDKFSAAQMYEKHGNLVDELSARDISDTGAFKMATGGGSIPGEYKFGNQFGFHNFSKFTFACNKIPDVTDMNDLAYFNRWMVVRFEKTIENKIPNFVDTLKNDEERSGLFNWAMEGLERLIAQGKFTYASSGMDTKKEMMRSGSSVAIFCAEQLKQDVGMEISKEDMYEAYVAYCLRNSLGAETIKMFGTKLPFYVAYINDGLITETNGKRVRGWRNVSVLKTKEEEVISETADDAFNKF